MLVSAAWILMAVLAAINHIVTRRVYGLAPGRLHDLLFGPTGIALVCAFIVPLSFAASRRWPFTTRRLAKRVALHIGVAFTIWLIAVSVYQGALALTLNPHAAAELSGSTGIRYIAVAAGRVLEWTFNTLPIGTAVYLSGVGVEHAIRYFIEAREREVQMARLSEQLTSARFATLQAQLNPHFLFNTLNTIAVRARDGDGAGTARMVEQLGDVLRRTLGRDIEHEVTLGEELELVREYLAIEEARFADRLRPTIDVDPSLLDVAVPSFALQHLIENAVRHGISTRPGAGSLNVGARREGDILVLTVADDGPGVDESSDPTEGHGIASTRERLHALYGDRAGLTVARDRAGGTIATLKVPYRVIEPEPQDAGY
jgi:signal transduction histidine kinase